MINGKDYLDRLRKQVDLTEMVYLTIDFLKTLGYHGQAQELQRGLSTTTHPTSSCETALAGNDVSPK